MRERRNVYKYYPAKPQEARMGNKCYGYVIVRKDEVGKIKEVDGNIYGFKDTRDYNLRACTELGFEVFSKFKGSLDEVLKRREELYKEIFENHGVFPRFVGYGSENGIVNALYAITLTNRIRQKKENQSSKQPQSSRP